MEEMFFSAAADQPWLKKREPLTGHSLIIRNGEGSEATYFVRSFQQNGSGRGNETQGEMSDCHLVTNGAHLIMSGLLNFAIAEVREVAFDFRAESESLLEKGAIAWDTGAGIVGNVQIFGAAISLAVETVEKVLLDKQKD